MGVARIFQGEHFWKIEKNLLRKLRKMHYFCIFLKEFNKSCVTILCVWTKNPNFWEILKVFDENSVEKWNFYFYVYFGKFVTKIEPSEITPSYYSNLFGLGEGEFPPSPLLRP